VSDRTPPGIHEPPKKSHGCLWLVLTVLLIAAGVGGCNAILAANREPYDANNEYEAIAQCEARVRERLRAPSTATFNLSATGSGTWTVIGTVDAENGFGAMIRSNVQCTVIIEGDRARVRIDRLDGE